MAIKNRSKREIIAYLPEDLVLASKVENYLALKNKDSEVREYSKSQLVIDALNFYFKKINNR